VGDTQAGPRRDPFNGFLVAACIVLAVLVVALSWQNCGLKHDVEELGNQLAELEPGGPERLQAGETLGALSLASQDGGNRELVFGDGEERTLLLIFSVHCPACNETMPMWEELVREVRDTPGLRILAVQTDRPGEGEESELVTVALPFEVYGLDREGSPGMSLIPYIPATIVVDTAGMVERIWFGIPSAEDLDELRDALGR
jgi:peroxiredoxin